MKVTISELRSMIREALEERMMSEEPLPEEAANKQAPSMGPAGTGLEEEIQQEGWHELEEAWNELEEASGLQEAAAKKEKEEKKPAKKEEKKADSKKEEPAKERKEAGMNITKAQLMAALDLNPDQEIDFKRAINKGHSVADALAAATATKKKAAKKED